MILSCLEKQRSFTPATWLVAVNLGEWPIGIHNVGRNSRRSIQAKVLKQPYWEMQPECPLSFLTMNRSWSNYSRNLCNLVRSSLILKISTSSPRKWLLRNPHRRVYKGITRLDSGSSQRPWRLLWHPRYPSLYGMTCESPGRWWSIHTYFGDPESTLK